MKKPKKKNCKHKWELIYTMTFCTPRFALYLCKKCGEFKESEKEL